MTDQACALCNIPKERILVEGPLTVTALFHNPQVPGHVIVAAKEHQRFPGDLGDDVNAELGIAVAAAFTRATKLTGSERSYVAVVGDRDFHFHYHVLPIGARMPPLGPYLFGAEGWASHANKDQIDSVNATLMQRWRE